MAFDGVALITDFGAAVLERKALRYPVGPVSHRGVSKPHLDIIRSLVIILVVLRGAGC